MNVSRIVGNVAAVAAVVSMMAVASPARADQYWRHHHSGMRYYHVSEYAGNSNAVIVGGTPIMRFHFSAGGYTPEQRAYETTQRLTEIMSAGPIFPSDITVQPTDKGDAVVLVKGQLLFTADSATAEFNDSTPIELANHWADHLRDVLPGLTEPK